MQCLRCSNGYCDSYSGCGVGRGAGGWRTSSIHYPLINENNNKTYSVSLFTSGIKTGNRLRVYLGCCYNLCVLYTINKHYLNVLFALFDNFSV